MERKPPSPESRRLTAGLRRILAALGALTLSSCYVTTQGIKYLSLRTRAVGIEKILSDPEAPEKLKDLARRAERIRAFAVGELGLRDTRNYRSLVRLDSDHLATVVSACDPVSFDRYLWNYPVVGPLPYKGFFNPRDAEREAARLRAKGLDTLVRPVDAFSTLGWFADPLFSNFARYDDGELADLIIHELSHATVFVKGRDQFNEEFATFVGRRGARLYIARTYGPDSPELSALDEARADAEAFADYLRETAGLLEALYSSERSREEKLEEKSRILSARAEEFRKTAARRFREESYRTFPMDRINNAYLDLYRLYEGEPELYSEYLEGVCGGDLVRFIREAERIAKSGADPKEVMRRPPP
ncbi:MAG: aminopeptidase [Treponema sp.]|nr:aminopeptidase [Treponema sp.]